MIPGVRLPFFALGKSGANPVYSIGPLGSQVTETGRQEAVNTGRAEVKGKSVGKTSPNSQAATW